MNEMELEKTMAYSDAFSCIISKIKNGAAMLERNPEEFFVAVLAKMDDNAGYSRGYDDGQAELSEKIEELLS